MSALFDLFVFGGFIGKHKFLYFIIHYSVTKRTYMGLFQYFDLFFSPRNVFFKKINSNQLVCPHFGVIGYGVDIYCSVSCIYMLPVIFRVYVFKFKVHYNNNKELSKLFSHGCIPNRFFMCFFVIQIMCILLCID